MFEVASRHRALAARSASGETRADAVAQLPTVPARALAERHTIASLRLIAKRYSTTDVIQ